MTLDWQDISTFPLPTDEWQDAPPSVLVWNGEIVGEAQVRTDYGAWDPDDDTIPWRWAWTHRSTCSCCHSFMEPQPLKWAPMPGAPTS